MARKYAREQPDPHEIDLYEKLLSREGLACGVLDPDFADPLDGKLTLERGFRYTLQLDCEDESLNLCRVVGSMRCEPRDGVSGFGFALLEADLPGQKGSSQEIRVLVFAEECNRNALLALLEHLTDHRSFRRRGASLLAWLPTGCMAGCLSGCVGRGKAPGLPHEFSDNSPRLRSESSFARHRPEKEAASAHLEGLKAYARQLWDRQTVTGSLRKSGSLGDLSTALRQYSRRKETKDTKESKDTKEARSSTPAGKDKDNKLPANDCAVLLHRLLLEMDPSGDGQAVAGFELFRLSTSFEEFWDVLQSMLLIDALLAEPKLQSRFGDTGTPVMTLEKWSWFLVQVQNEERAVVEAAASQLKAMEEPYVDSGQLTIAGLSVNLCVQKNSAIRPDLCEKSCEMDRPISDYWISTAHHVILETVEADVPHPPSSPVAEEGNMLEPFLQLLQDGCRCFSLALVESTELQDKTKLQVVLQKKRVSFADVLELLAAVGFRMSEYPILLVLSLHQLVSPTQRGEVAELVYDKLGERLWRSSRDLPSPEEAKNHVVVVLAPNCDVDPGLESPTAQRGGVNSTVEESEVMEAWQEAAKNFTVWCGQVFDRTFAQKLPGENSVGFLPSDELRSLAEFKQQSMLEYHRQYLSLSFPVAPRQAPVNYNPAAAWSCGVQMAALTLGCGGSGCDGAVLAHTGLFSLNGGCGYVLKPAFLRNSSGAQAAAQPKPIYLEVRLVAARAVPGIDAPLPKGPVVLSASIWGAPTDCARQDYHPVKATGLVICWPDAAGLGFNVASPHAAILVVELFELDQKGGYRRVAFSAAAVHGLRQGLRWLPLLSPRGGRRATSHGALSGMLAHITLVEGGRRASLQRATPLGLQ
ncbi:unnamed protein product [Durusdinium trenchii]|uniref:Phosphoinositide phospholipase C n=1 Tax=Durusdinium trenchii TaxID=1381693 RepID=A0ABP0IBN4_9DINO